MNRDLASYKNIGKSSQKSSFKLIPTSVVNSNNHTFHQGDALSEDSDAEEIPQEDESYYCSRNLERANGAQYGKLAKCPK